MKLPHESQQPPGDPFELILRKALHEELTPPPRQDGFSDQVLARLPRRKQQRWWGWAPCVGALAGGIVFAFADPNFLGNLARLSATTRDIDKAVSSLAPWIPLVLTGLVCSGLSMLERR